MTLNRMRNDSINGELGFEIFAVLGEPEAFDSLEMTHPDRVTADSFGCKEGRDNHTTAKKSRQTLTSSDGFREGFANALCLRGG